MENKFDISPIIVTGVGRSGTSILLEIILRHPEVAGLGIAGENPFMGATAKFLTEYFNEGDVNYKQANNRISREQLVESFRTIILKNSIGHDKWGNKKFWATKAFPHSSYMSLLNELFPNAKYVYVVRHPVDVINSTLNYEGFKAIGVDFQIACNRWVQGCEAYSCLLNLPNAMTIKYEKMIKEKNKFINQLLSFCNLSNEYEEVCFKYFENNKINSSFSSGKEKNNFNHLDEWSPNQISYLKDLAGYWLDKFEYDLGKR